MSLLRKLAKGAAAGVAAGVARSATDRALNNRPQNNFQQPPPVQHQPPPVQHHQPPVHHQPPPRQPQQPSAIEGAFASLLGSAEKFVDRAGTMFGVCPKCQTATPHNTACAQCGTMAPPMAGQAPPVDAGPRQCVNCGAQMQGNICEYCS